MKNATGVDLLMDIFVVNQFNIYLSIREPSISVETSPTEASPALAAPSATYGDSAPYWSSSFFPLEWCRWQ